MKTSLCLITGVLALASLPLRAADEKKDAATEKAGVTLDQVKLGDPILNGPVTMDDLKNKVVVVELWGIH